MVQYDTQEEKLKCMKMSYVSQQTVTLFMFFQWLLKWLNFKSQTLCQKYGSINILFSIPIDTLDRSQLKPNIHYHMY